jgi:hypothetical protein
MIAIIFFLGAAFIFQAIIILDIYGVSLAAIAERRRRRRKTKGQEQSREKPPPWWKMHWKVIAAPAGGIAAIVSFASAIATFLPRVSIDIGDPSEPSNAFSAPVTVTNTFVALERASLALGIAG